MRLEDKIFRSLCQNYEDRFKLLSIMKENIADIFRHVIVMVVVLVVVVVFYSPNNIL